MTQRPSEKRFIFGETDYKARKVEVIPGEIGGIKVRVKTEVVEEDILWIIGKYWMIEKGLKIDMNRKEIRLGEKYNGIKWREGVKGLMKVEV